MPNSSSMLSVTKSGSTELKSSNRMSHGCSRESTKRTILEVKGHFHFSVFNTVDPLSERLSLIIRNLFPNPGTLTKKKAV